MTCPSAEEIRAKALEIGWDDVGFTPAHIPDKDISAYLKWLAEGKHGDLKYMENQMRTDPSQWLSGARTAILFVSYYKQELAPFQEDKGVIASYARGRDYHNVHRKRIKTFISWLEEKTGQTGIARGFSDSAPILEKALAVQAGLGWFGKNTLVIHRKFGTFFLLSGIYTTLTIPSQTLETHQLRCGTCTRCIDACPTKALSPYNLDATKCLSYHLIESKEDVDSEIAKLNPGYAFGCDICQDVCPHNARKPTTTRVDFLPAKGLGAYLDPFALAKIREKPEMLFGTPLQRRGVKGLTQNLEKITKTTCS